MDVSAMTGLEIMQAFAARHGAGMAILDTIPVSDMTVAPGFTRMVARADRRHLNPMGGVHGGLAATLLDSVTGCAVYTMLGAGVGYATVDLAVKMLRPVPRDMDLIAEGRTTHVSRNIAAAEGSLKTSDGKLLASASVTCFVRQPAP